VPAEALINASPTFSVPRSRYWSADSLTAISDDDSIAEICSCEGAPGLATANLDKASATANLDALSASIVPT